MNARVLAFPLSVAAIAALDGCQGITINDPSVRICRTDSVAVEVVYDDGHADEGVMVIRENPGKCRKAA